MPDDELARRARLGDKQAFVTIVERHGPVVFRYARRMVGAEDAPDLTQETFATAWVAIPGFRGDSAVRTWLLGIASNHVRHHRRSLARHPVAAWDGDEDERTTPVSRTPEASPERQAVDDAFRTALESALADLPPLQRACWVLRDVEGLGYAEIADVEHTSVAAVRGALHRARTSLARRLEPWR